MSYKNRELFLVPIKLWLLVFGITKNNIRRLLETGRNVIGVLYGSLLYRLKTYIKKRPRLVTFSIMKLIFPLHCGYEITAYLTYPLLSKFISNFFVISTWKMTVEKEIVFRQGFNCALLSLLSRMSLQTGTALTFLVLSPRGNLKIYNCPRNLFSFARKLQTTTIYTLLLMLYGL